MKMFLRLIFIFGFLLESILMLPAQMILQKNVDYINRYSGIAVKHRDKYGIPASITLAQGILESGAGTSELAKEANNHFGIKCRSDWQGEQIYRQLYGRTTYDCFRKYKNAEDSYEDRAKYILQNSKYDILFTYDMRDYIAWAKGLQICGYAADKGYANKLVGLIEEYELYKYDSGTAPEKIHSAVPEKEVLHRVIYKTHNLLYVVARSNDSFNQIAEDTGFRVRDLLRYNEVPENFPLKKGDIVYLEEKKRIADKPYFEHIVKIGESMHSISQLYGIRLESLYQMNKEKAGYISEGDVLQLR